MSESTETALAVTEVNTGEIAPTSAQAMAKHEIESAITIARRFPRNEDAAFAKVMQSCKRPLFASLACYSYPRGGQQIRGPSVQLAREVARCWGNIRFGCDVVQDDDKTRTIRGWAWDIETNTKETQDATFKKLIFRKKGGGQWIEPDERDLRELTNKQGAICVRNCLLHLVPPDLIEDAIQASRQTIEKDMGNDPTEHRKKIIMAFQGIGVSVDDLSSYLGHPLPQVSPSELADLRTIWQSISDGNSVWAEYIPEDSDGDALEAAVNKPKPKAAPKKPDKKPKRGSLDAEKPAPKKTPDKKPAPKPADPAVDAPPSPEYKPINKEFKVQPEEAEAIAEPPKESGLDAAMAKKTEPEKPAEKDSEEFLEKESRQAMREDEYMNAFKDDTDVDALAEHLSNAEEDKLITPNALKRLKTAAQARSMDF